MYCRIAAQDHRTVLARSVSRLFYNVHNRITQEKSDWENGKVLSSRRNETIDEAARTRGGRELQARATATGCYQHSQFTDDLLFSLWRTVFDPLGSRIWCN